MAVDRTVSMTMNGSSAGVPAAAKLRWRADRHVMLIETTFFWEKGYQKMENCNS